MLIEVGNLLHSVQQRQRAADFIEACYGTTNVTVVSVDTELLRKAVDFYRLHQDKDWGLTGLHLFVVMTGRDLTLCRCPFPAGWLSCADAGSGNLTSLSTQKKRLANPPTPGTDQALVEHTIRNRDASAIAHKLTCLRSSLRTKPRRQR